ncbi:MAG: hypothetical protein RL698_517 [Pseudomonadota bacterium]|jgi:hypothetical protein
MSKGRAADSLWQRLLGVGEDRMGSLLGDLLSSPQVAEALGATLNRAARTKGTVDRNMQVLLSTLNVPSRQDLSALNAKVEALQGSLVNLNIKLDRLIAANTPAPQATGADRAAPRRRPRQVARATPKPRR